VEVMAEADEQLRVGQDESGARSQVGESEMADPTAIQKLEVR